MGGWSSHLLLRNLFINHIKLKAMKKSKEKITNVPQVQTIRKQINVPVIYRTNDEGKIVYDYGAMHDIFEEEMSKLDTKQYSETSR